MNKPDKKTFEVRMTKEYSIEIKAIDPDVALREAHEKDVIEWELIGLDINVDEVEEDDDEEDFDE